MRIHITLVGGQMMPVYLGIKNTELDKIILIHSSDSLKNAEQIEKIYREKCLLVEFSPVDYNSIKDSIDKLLTKYIICITNTGDEEYNLIIYRPKQCVI